jgi:hypothetical protein
MFANIYIERVKPTINKMKAAELRKLKQLQKENELDAIINVTNVKGY